MPFVQYATYIAVAVSILAMLAKAFRYLKAPEHFRWELYPVPHEKGRADYGGSYLEELDWWTKSRQSDKFRELLEMFQEIILLKGVYHNNKKVWVFSFPFHFGMYLCIGWLLLLLLGAIIEANGVVIGAAAGGFGVIVHYLTLICGYVGLVLSGLGAFGLFMWRLTDSLQRLYSSPSDYVNLLLLDIIVVVALIAHGTSDPSFAALRGYVQALATFSPATVTGTLFTAEILLVSLLILYIPLTRMSHFVAKYFLYHSIRWNDEPNFRGSAIEKRIIDLLGQKVGWAAPHIQTGQPWTEVLKGEDK